MTVTLAEMTAEFLDMILPTAKEGWLIVAVGSGPRLDANGKYCHNSWRETPFHWPQMRDAAVAEIQAHAAHADVYICPYLMKTPQRSKGNAAWRALLHCDVDTPIDPGVVDGLGGHIVWSGSQGHGHVYIVLSYPVMPTQHDILERGLVARLHGDPAKISENDLLRPPGTFNHKSAVNGAMMTPVWSS